MKYLAVSVLTAMASFAQTEEPEVHRTQARSMVITKKYGIVASSQTLASAAGVKILEAGGNAIDAAIAANAVLGLVEPTSNGIGGDLFAIIHEAKTGKLHGLNASGWAPTGLTIDFVESKGHKTMPQRGILSVSVPGAVAGWHAMHGKLGKLPMSRVLAPAIHYAEEGFPVTEWISGFWGSGRAKPGLDPHPNAGKLYLPGGKAPAVGEVFRNPALAQSLKRIAAQGRDGFYKGPTADAILAISKELGGTMTAADLTDFRAEWVEPISTEYRGWRVSELPPNGQGIAALEMLNIMERFPVGGNAADDMHLMIEAKKLAYADLLRYIGDPRGANLPIAALLSKEHAKGRAARLDMKKAACQVVPAELLSTARQPGADTIYLSVIDKEGNMVSFIQSNFEGFGSGIVPNDAGFMLHNRAGLFTLERNHPNALAPRKRPIHTIIPGFMEKGDTRIAFGIMGGWNQAQAHAQFVSNIVDRGMNIQAALEQPRFTKKTFEGCDVYIEMRVPEDVRAELTKRGHQLHPAVPFSSEVGGGQAVMSDGKGVHYGASDPRKDGAALPESPSFFR